VGGEMVSLAAVEVLAGDLWPNVLSAVMAMPDPRKGERLILITQQRDATRSQFLAYAREKGASELMIPADVIVIEKLPLLRTGKVDLLSLATVVKEHYAAKDVTKEAVKEEASKEDAAKEEPMAQAHG